MSTVDIIGAGLAGCEAALILANNNFKINLFEMKPHKKTPAQKLDTIAELVCSNSFRSTKSTNAVGLLKDELILMGSPLMYLAHETRVPAGDALAIDRIKFSKLVEEKIKNHPNIKFIAQEITKIEQKNNPVIIATGPLTSDSLAREIINLVGQESLDFYDAIAPIIDFDSIDLNHAFKQSRYQQEEDSGDYINCPLDKNTYDKFITQLNNSSKAQAHEFENAKYFEGCLPIEVLAERGPETLRFGAFKPVGLIDPQINKTPHAVLQLRKEDIFGSSYNLVGCQTRMRIPEQLEAFRLIPALKKAVFMRYGSIHRNTYINSPDILDLNLCVKNTQIYLAGQITGVEGYVESTAMGLIIAHQIINKNLKNNFFPQETALGGLYAHVLGLNRADKKSKYVPSNITWAMMPPISQRFKSRALKRQALYERAINSLKIYTQNITTNLEQDSCARIHQ